MFPGCQQPGDIEDLLFGCGQGGARLLQPCLRRAALLCSLAGCDPPCPGATARRPSRQVLASYGHVRDLPARGAAVRPDEGFALRWALLPGAAERLAALAAAARRAARLVPATDPDREGEAIAWHVTQELQARAALCAALELHTVGRLLCMPIESWRPAAACGRPVPRALGASSAALSRPGLAALTCARACCRQLRQKQRCAQPAGPGRAHQRVRVRQDSHGALAGVDVARIAFTEVTQRAVLAALAQPRPVRPRPRCAARVCAVHSRKPIQA